MANCRALNILIIFPSSGRVSMLRSCSLAFLWSPAALSVPDSMSWEYTLNFPHFKRESPRRDTPSERWKPRAQARPHVARPGETVPRSPVIFDCAALSSEWRYCRMSFRLALSPLDSFHHPHPPSLFVVKTP